MKRFAPAIFLGLVAGFQGGLFGVGGGLVMVPGMVLFLAIPQHRAHATSLAAMIASASAAVVPLALDNRIDWDTAAFLVVGSMVGAYLGARLFSRIPEVWLAGGFMVLALASAVRRLLEHDAAGAAAAGTPTIDTWWLGVVGLVLVGFSAGVLGALMGVGGGIVNVPALVTLYAFEQHLAQGTSLAVIVPTALVAAITHSRRGQVDWRLAGLLASGGLAGGWLGARTALALDGSVLRILFVCFMLLMVARMLARTWRRPRQARAVPGDSEA
ncbi:MAG: sulfite exporter TauE/SafE family protein [Actinomycetota bacterium]